MLIYKITNKINGKIYIGQTTRTLKERWSDYIKEYKYIKEDSKNLRLIIKAFRKYGIDNFEITVLEDSIETLEELNNKERDYILKYNCTDKTIGYNIEFGGNGFGKHTEEQKRKISEAQLGEKNHMWGIKGELNKCSKKVIELTTGKIYASATEATEKLNLGVNAITKVCACARGDRNSTHNLVFRYLDDELNPIYVDLPKSEKEVKYVIDIDHNITYDSVEDASKKLNIKPEYIRTSCNKGTKTGGIHFKYGEMHTITYCKGSKIFNKVLPEYKYLVNTVLSSNTEKV